ncbi:thyroid transcription factor 1-associated protein 26 homolog [Bombus pascuorum]|uniref:thyroid transcription factor 1-associated protein 26 homolog n=1 Tax=Bombus pascuorum TaxID=65598 RepID=UPI00298D903E|nr:thyroid transcription factor 1-associated protein 26 homolog [Bombus pascuorum]
MKSHVRDVSNKKQSKYVSNGKKPFDKKKYRLQKYSNKYKVTQWEQRRKKAVLRGFYKQIDKDQQQNLRIFASKANDQNGHENQPRRLSAFHKAKQEFLDKKNEKRERVEEASRVKAEREEALKRYKEKKMQTYKQLSRKTKKGQPVMKARLEMLLEKIEQQMAH